MHEYLFETEAAIPASREQVFAFFSDVANLMSITPSTLHLRILTPGSIEMKDGTIIDYVIRLYGVPLRWRTLISRWNPPFDFVDEQLRGPYRTWVHQHSFSEMADGQTRMKDSVRYSLPLPFGLVALPFVQREIAGIFRYRAKVIGEVFPSA